MFQNGSSLSDDVMRKNRRGRNVPTDPTRGQIQLIDSLSLLGFVPPIANRATGATS
jgi:hypothetical protein